MIIVAGARHKAMLRAILLDAMSGTRKQPGAGAAFGLVLHARRAGGHAGTGRDTFLLSQREAKADFDPTAETDSPEGCRLPLLRSQRYRSGQRGGG
jgi:hypothetical protein